MRKISTLFVILFLTVMTACSDDLATKQLVNTQEAADGEWHLVQVTGSIAGVNHVFEPGTITWTFNDNGTVSVINTNTNESLSDFFNTGTYEYSFVANEDAPEMCESVLMVDNIDFGCHDLDGDHLTLTNVWVDGYQLKFVKM